MVTEEVAENIASQLLRRGIKTVSVWGIENVSDAFLQNAVLSQMQIDYYIDSDAVLGQQFRGKEVLTPEEAVARGIKAVVILSKPIQKI